MKYTGLKGIVLAAGLAVSMGCMHIKYYPQNADITPVKIDVGIFGNVNELEVKTKSGKMIYYTYEIGNNGLEEVRYLKEVVGDLEKKAVTKTSEKEIK